MMTFSIYSALIPTAKQILTNQSKILAQGAAFAEAHQIDQSTLLDQRLAPDMFPLSRQVQIACDMVKKGAARLTGVEAPVFEDDETTIAELQHRISKTIAFLDGIDERDFIGAETRAITFPVGPEMTMNFSGEDYVNQWILPNFYFHVTTTYNILRQQGVALGKRDFLG
jgi:uncharacterized protein